MSNKKINTLTKTISLVTVVAVISKVLGLLREIGIAAIFGVSLETDAFYLTLAIPSLLFISIGVAISNLFIIEFAKKKENKDLNEQSYLTSNISNILTVVSIFIFIISFIFTPFIIKVIAPGFKDLNKFNLAVKLTRILLPTIVLIPVYQIKASVLKVYDKFVLVNIVDLAFNLFQIVYLLLFANKFGIVGLAYSVTFSYLFQLIVINIVTYKVGIRFKPILNFKDENFILIMKLFIPTFISFGIIQINATVDKMIASNLGDGAISALNYAFMLRTVAFSIIVTSVITVIYPLLLKIKEDKEAFHKTLNNTLKLIITIMTPLSILMILFNKEIVFILFEREMFTHEDSLLTALVLIYYVIGMPFYSVKSFLVHVSYTYKDSKTPLYITIANALLNIVLSLILKEFMGVNGVALGLSISEIISLILMVYLMKRKGYFNIKEEVKDIIKIVSVNLIIFIVLFIFRTYLIINGTKLTSLLLVSLYSLVILSVYVILMKVFRVSLVREFINDIRKKE